MSDSLIETTARLSNLGISAAEPAAPASTLSASLEELPQELLLKVWLQLEDPAPLSQVNKRFHALSKDTLFRAQWLTQHYKPYEVVFEAIARPKIFTGKLLDLLLIEFKAPLTRNVVQLTSALKYSREELVKDADIRWGINISSSAYGTLMQHALSVHGFDFCTLVQDCDSIIFTGWVIGQEKQARSTGIRPKPDEKVQLLFNAGFMPLPLALIEEDDGVHVKVSKVEEVIIRAIQFDASLAAPILQQGYVLTVKETEDILDAWAFEFFPDKVLDLLQIIMIDGVLNISPNYVKYAFYRRQSLADAEIKAPERLDRAIEKCEVLVGLNRIQGLPFRLEDVVPRFSDEKEDQYAAALKQLNS